VALWKALFAQNIKISFQKIGIWSSNPHATEDKMRPSEAFFVADKAQVDSFENEELDANDPLM
jgi:argonaute-like protein implicated in RNA metabolism and viral defense